MTDTTCFSFTLLSFVQACWVPAYTELLYLPRVLHDVPCDQLGMELGDFHQTYEAPGGSIRTESLFLSKFS